MSNNIISRFINTKTFIYNANNNYYVISGGKYRECTNEEIKLYNEFKIELDKTKNLPYTLENKDVIQVLKLYEKIENIDIFATNDETEFEIFTYRKLFGELSEKELNILDKQRDDLTRVIDYREGLFHRYSPV